MNVDYSQKATILKCLKCGDEIQSNHRWNLVDCSCGNIFTDGGNEYGRYGFESKEFEIVKPFGETK